MSHVDDRFAATAAVQHAMLTRWQVLAAGGSDSMIRRRLRSGRWVRCGRGVYALAGVPWTWRRKLCALWLSLCDRALVSHRAAAKLLGVGGDGDPPFEFSVPVDQAPRRTLLVPDARPDDPIVIVHESVDLHRATSTIVDGMQITAPVRLAVDLGSVIPFDRYRTAVARMESNHGLTTRNLERQYRLHSVQGRNGCGALRDLLDLRHESNGTPDEYVEILAADILVAAGLPVPVHQFHVQRRDGTSAFFDLAYPELRIGIETEGRIHLREDVHQEDHTRRNQLLLDGWVVLHFTYADVTRRPAYVVETVRAAIAARRAGAKI